MMYKLNLKSHFWGPDGIYFAVLALVDAMLDISNDSLKGMLQ